MKRPYKLKTRIDATARTCHTARVDSQRSTNMKLEFDSVEEVKDFMSQLKGTRGKKGDVDDVDAKAPAPIMPPATSTAFAPPQAGFAPLGAPVGAPTTFAPFPTGMPAAAPEVIMLVQRINASIDAAIAKGQSPDHALNWFRQQCGPEAAAATLDQIKTVFLPRLTASALDNIVKLMGA